MIFELVGAIARSMRPTRFPPWLNGMPLPVPAGQPFVGVLAKFPLRRTAGQGDSSRVDPIGTVYRIADGDIVADGAAHRDDHVCERTVISKDKAGDFLALVGVRVGKAAPGPVVTGIIGEENAIFGANHNRVTVARIDAHLAGASVLGDRAAQERPVCTRVRCF